MERQEALKLAVNEIVAINQEATDQLLGLIKRNNEVLSLLGEALGEVPEPEQKYIPKMMTYDQAAEYLNVKKTTLYAWVHYKRIPHVTIGRAIRFDRTELDKILSLGNAVNVIKTINR